MLHSSVSGAMKTLLRWFQVEDEKAFRKRLEIVSEHCAICVV